MPKPKPKLTAPNDTYQKIHELLGHVFEVLDCTPVGDDPKAFVKRGGLRQLEREAMRSARDLVRIWAWPQMDELLGVATDQSVRQRLAGDLIYCAKAMGKWPKPTPARLREQNRERVRRFRERQRAKQG